MNLKNQQPIFVPGEYCAEIERLSKAALMDIVWDMATLLVSGETPTNADVMAKVRQMAEIILHHRKQEKKYG